MDFIVPARIRLDLADGTICLLDEVCVQLADRRPLYGNRVEQAILNEDRYVEVGWTTEGKLRISHPQNRKL